MIHLILSVGVVGFFCDMYRMRMRILAIYLWMDDGNYYMFI